MAAAQRLAGGAGAGGGRGQPRRRAPRWPWVLAAMIILPVIEISVIVMTGQQIGAGWTVLLLITMTALGAWLVGREGRRSWAALRKAVQSGRTPTPEIADALVVLVGGFFLLTPGFVTDFVGLVFLVPFTRGLGRRVVERMVASRVLAAGGPGVGTSPGAYGRWSPTQGWTPAGGSGQSAAGTGSASGAGPGSSGGSGRQGRDDIVEGEIVDEEPPDDGTSRP